MNGGVIGMGGVGRREFLRQPCCFKTTVALIKKRDPPSARSDVRFLPHQLAVDPGHCCCRIFWSSFSEF